MFLRYSWSVLGNVNAHRNIFAGGTNEDKILNTTEDKAQSTNEDKMQIRWANRVNTLIV